MRTTPRETDGSVSFKFVRQVHLDCVHVSVRFLSTQSDVGCGFKALTEAIMKSYVPSTNIQAPISSRIGIFCHRPTDR